MFDDSAPKITCHASGTTQGSELRWESNIWGWGIGPSYEIQLEQEYQLVPEVIVTLQECQGSDCELVTTTIDTSAIAQTPSATDSGSDGNGAAAPDFPATTTAPTSAVASGDTGANPAELGAVCTFDESVPKISCQAVGVAQGSQLRWESNVWGWTAGNSYDVELLEQYQLVPEVVVTLQECQGSDCELVTTTIDTSAIAQTPSATDSGSDGSVPDVPVAAQAMLPAKIESLTCTDQQITAGSETTCRAVVSGEVDFVGWHSDGYMFLPWDRDQTEISLEDTLVYVMGFTQEGDYELMIQVCTGKPWRSGAMCVEDSVSISVGPMELIDIVRWFWTGGVCEGNGSQMFPVSPISPDQLDYIKPLGDLNGGHPTPVSHQYWYARKDVVAEARSPVSGTIVALTNRGTANVSDPFGGATGQDYEVQYIIEVSCDLYLILDHVIGVPEAISTALGEQSGLRPRIPVSAGEVLGHVTDGFKVDFGVVDLTRAEVTGFARSESYYQCAPNEPTYPMCGEPFKLFERDSFEYFEEPLRSQLEEKSLSVVEPRGGVFVYDVPGTAQGTWFQEGTYWYGGSAEASAKDHGHLALVPDNLAPSKLRVSLGDGFTGSLVRIMGVTGSSPTFDTITPASGRTSYELRLLLPCDGSSITVPGRARDFACNTGEPLGTLLLEMLDDSTIRVEVLYNVSPTSAPTFTDSARTYLR